MAIEIELRKFKDIDLKGGIMIDCIPVVNIVSGVVGSYIVSALNLDQVFALESEQFPPISMVFSKKPKFPARGYASEKHKVAVILSEFQPPPSLSRPLAYKLLSCFEECNCSKIISFEGLPTMDKKSGNNNENKKAPQIYGLGSTDIARKMLDDAEIEQLETGMVVGVTAVLMNEGRWQNKDVITLIGEIRDDVPTVRLAARLLDMFNKLYPRLGIDVKPLLDEAEKVESHFTKLQAQAKPVIGEAPTVLYG